MVFYSRSRMLRFPSTACMENSRDSRHSRQRKKEYQKGDRGASRKGIPVDLVQKKRAQKPTGSKWDLINPAGPLLEVVDVRAESTVERRDILMIGPVKRNKTSLKVVTFFCE